MLPPERRGQKSHVDDGTPDGAPFMDDVKTRLLDYLAAWTERCCTPPECCGKNV